jgi:DNA-binding ferritin-like protein (Dps family)
MSKSLANKLKTDIEDKAEKKQFIVKLLSLSDEYKKLTYQNIDNFLLKTYVSPHSRDLTGDFITILRSEGKQNQEVNDISTKITTDCLNNFNETFLNDDPKCFCCGEPISVNISNGKKIPTNVSCDHVIPIITMLVCVDKNSVSKNLHFIHSSCNQKKGNKDIFNIYKNIGKTDGIFKCKNDNVEYCREKFLNILKQIKFRDFSDMNYRASLLPDFQEKVREIKEYYERYLNDGAFGANILMDLANKKSLSLILSNGSSTNSSSMSM